MLTLGAFGLGAMALCHLVFHVDTVVLSGLLFVSGTGLIALGQASRQGRVLDRAKDLIEDTDAARGCPIELLILQGGRKTGEDVGVAWFEDDSLYFAGETCSFAIGARDLHRGERWRLAVESHVGVGALDMIYLQSEGPLLALRLRPAYEGFESLSQYESLGPVPEEAREFVRQLGAFKPGSGGPERSFYPPLEIAPALAGDRGWEFLRPPLWVRVAVFAYVESLFLVAGSFDWVGPFVALFVTLAMPRVDLIFRRQRALAAEQEPDALPRNV